MLRKVLHSKIHMARCTAAKPDYVGSITIDADLLDAVGMRVSDAVLVADCENGNRFETYVFEGERGSGAVEVNGAAATLTGAGHRLIVLHFAVMDDAEYAEHHPRVVVPAEGNRVGELIRYSPGPQEPAHGEPSP